jgi:S-disulfanyl-L-cysteine oxidoreductase SoxD
MRYFQRLAVVAAGGLVLYAAPAAAQNGAAAGDQSVLRGVYTQSQSSKGKATFLNVCANCHASGQFKGESFQRAWAGRTVYDLFSQLRNTMPQDNPGGLSPQEYAAVIAYFLELNGYPTGAADLPTATDALKKIRFEAPAEKR